MLEIIFIIPPGGNEILSPFSDRFSGWFCSPGQTEGTDVFDLAFNTIEVLKAHSWHCHEFRDPIFS